jgi:hypothetical protein
VTDIVGIQVAGICGVDEGDPASSAAWIVLIERCSSGLPSMDIGIPPSPIALTATSPI